MHKNRLEAFSDGVIAIIITIMVLEMKVPHGVHLSELEPILPVFLSYVLSFVYVGIYWNNHHHLFQAVQHVTGAVLWALFLAIVFWPMHQRVRRIARKRPSLAAFLTLLTIVVIVILPLSLVSASVVEQASFVYQKVKSGDMQPGQYLQRMFDALPAWAHEGHGLAGSHWHATDTFGLLLVGGLVALLVWFTRGGK